MELKTIVPKEGDILSYMNKPVKNGMGEVIGVIIKAEDLGDNVELTMNVMMPELVSRPLVRSSFSIGGK